METKRVIIDTDVGIDDAVAVLMLLSAASKQKVQIEGILSVFGNVGAAQAAENCTKLCDLFEDLTIPIYQGCTEPLILKGRNTFFWPGHGKDGLGDAGDKLPPPSEKNKKKDEHAAIWLANTVASHPPNTFDIIFLGPLTNLAMAVKLNPSIASKFRSVIFMGGCHLGKGNSSCFAAEFNHFSDPEAAAIVFETIPKSVMISWELSLSTAPSWEWYDEHFIHGEDAQQPIRKLCKEMITIYYESRRSNYGFNLCDVVAVAYYLDNDIATSSVDKYVCCETKGELTRGSTVIDWMERTDKKNVTIVQEINQEKYLTAMLQYLDHPIKFEIEKTK